MANYIDIIVTPVPRNKLAAYRKEAEQFFQVMREYGALSCVEVEGDDVPVGKVTSFPRSVALKEDEAVFAAIVTYRDRAHRDTVSAKAMKDPRLADMDPSTMSFDAKRIFFGGFKPFLGQIQSAPAVRPYLFFRGRCEEAIEYYRKTLGAEVLMKMRFGENPEMPDADKVPSALSDKIMHSCLRIQGAEIMMSDGMKTGPLDFQCMSLSLSVPSEADADRVFNALAAEGTVQMPLGKTFFSPRFGAVADKFGVSWMVIVPQEC